MALAAVPNRQLFIDGEWREPIKKNRIPIINPATEEIIGTIPAATPEDVDIVVEGEPFQGMGEVARRATVLDFVVDRLNGGGGGGGGGGCNGD